MKELHQENASQHPCGFCDKVFPTKQRQLSHLRSHTKERGYKCLECDKSYVYLAALIYHRDAIHKKIKFPCPVPNCGQICSSAEILRKHQEVLHDPDSVGNSLVPCPICAQKLKKRNMANHFAVHKNKGKFRCDKCTKSLSCADGLRKHAVIHLALDQRPVFPCNLCDFRSKSKGKLNSHKRVKHSMNPKTYDCTFCDKTFLYSNVLKVHFRTHTKEMPYPCEQCEKAFVSEAILNAHVQIVHLGEKRYKCSHCSKVYSYSTDLARHLSLSHQGGVLQRDPCPTCGKMIAKGSMRKHLDVHITERIHKCDQCNKRFKTNTDLQTHIKRTHSAAQECVCTTCGKEYKSKASLRAHMINHLNKKFNCEICPKEYSSLNTLRAHIRNSHRPRSDKFKCQFCQAKFDSGYRLNRHIRTHIGEKNICQDVGPTYMMKKGTLHAGESSYKCKFCPEIYSSMKNWGKHVRTHPEFFKTRELGECKRPTNFKCSRCKKSFVHNIYLIQYLTTHRLETEFDCRPCIVLVDRLKISTKHIL